MLSTLKNYIADMGVTDSFYQQIVNTEPSRMAIYQDDEFTALLPYEDPVFAEIMVSHQARIYGVTTSEMRRRNKDTKNCDATNLDRYVVCLQTINWGLSERVYLERDAKLKRECWFDEKHRFSEAEKATIDKTPQKQRSVLPLYIQMETCERNVMLGRSVPAQTSWFGWLLGR